MVNWFRKDGEGNFLWPGYGENLRVLKWMIDRIDGRADGRQTPVGIVPNPADLDLAGLEIAPTQINQALAVNNNEWKAEMASAGEFFAKIGPALPPALHEKHQELTATVDQEAVRKAG
jgi:phosphoenolpyruvate carboxykinase (GTP)